MHGILQARILGWVAISSSRGSSQPRDENRVSCISRGYFTTIYILFPGTTFSDAEKSRPVETCEKTAAVPVHCVSPYRPFSVLKRSLLSCHALQGRMKTSSATLTSSFLLPLHIYIDGNLSAVSPLGVYVRWFSPISGKPTACRSVLKSPKLEVLSLCPQHKGIKKKKKKKWWDVRTRSSNQKCSGTTYQRGQLPPATESGVWLLPAAKPVKRPGCGEGKFILETGNKGEGETELLSKGWLPAPLKWQSGGDKSSYTQREGAPRTKSRQLWQSTGNWSLAVCSPSSWLF